MKKIIGLIKESFKNWQEDDVIEYSAALAYFTIFSLAPLLIIAVAIAGLVYGKEAAQQQLTGQITETIGPQAAQFISRMLERASQPAQGITATVIGVVTVLLGAMRIFGQLKKMLNKIWGVKAPERGMVRGFMMQNLLSFLMVMGVGVLLLAMIVATTMVAALGRQLGGQVPGLAILWQIVNLAVSLGIFTLLFAMIYKVLPDVRIPWGDVWVGAAVTSVLFTIGKYLIGFYLSHSSIASPYGAAGSLVILLVFIYYAALILFFGAEFTEVYARRYGSFKALAETGEGSAAHGRAGGAVQSAPVHAAVAAQPHPGWGGRGGVVVGLAVLAVLRQLFHPRGKA